MWNHDANSEDNLVVTYRKHQHLPETTINPTQTSSRHSKATSRTTENKTVVESGTKKQKATNTSHQQPAGANS